MKESYGKAAASLANGIKAEDYVFILPDWDGSATKAFGLKDTNKTAGVAVLNTGGNIIGTHQNRDLISQAMQLLAGIK